MAKGELRRIVEGKARGAMRRAVYDTKLKRWLKEDEEPDWRLLDEDLDNLTTYQRRLLNGKYEGIENYIEEVRTGVVARHEVMTKLYEEAIESGFEIKKVGKKAGGRKAVVEEVFENRHDADGKFIWG